MQAAKQHRWVAAAAVIILIRIYGHMDGHTHWESNIFGAAITEWLVSPPRELEPLVVAGTMG